MEKHFTLAFGITSGGSFHAVAGFVFIYEGIGGALIRL
jgi:hypothetical protein